jgi:Tol biopolymer transport system component
VTLQAGRTLGHYEILSTLGAGGMGEVYRARDTHLGREVAIKLLLDEVSSDAERLARFEREARVLASLNHPHIATLHGFETEGATRFLVMELVEGETLADRIARGAIPIEEAIPMFVQIAEGLEAAHEKGVIHRDLKPANVKVAANGKVKILDFGLAKALVDELGAAASSALSHSPTLTLQATQRGQILGTAAYMSPEQAKGNTVDRRSDIWSFGACLFEALAGQRVFQGDDAPELLASVLTREPDWTALPAATPRHIRALLRRCLVKSPRERLHDIGDARIELALPLEESESSAGTSAVLPASTSKGSRARIALAGVVIGAALVAAAWAWWALRRDLGAPEPTLRKFSIEAGTNLLVWQDGLSGPVLSPDGKRIAFVHQDRIWVRDLASLEPRALPGTERGERPFWSPGNDWVGYFVGASTRAGTLWKAPIEEGPPTLLGRLPASTAYGATWSPAGEIIVASTNVDEVAKSRLYAIDAGGGQFRDLTMEGRAEDAGELFPQLLPDGETLLAVEVDAGDRWSIVARRGGVRSELAHHPGERLTFPVFSAAGYVVYQRKPPTPLWWDSAGIWAFRFDPEKLAREGAPFRVSATGFHPSLALDGTLLYHTIEGESLEQLAWVDRSGKLLETLGEPHGNIDTPEISPDGRRIAYAAGDAQNDVSNMDLWILDLEDGSRSRLTVDPAVDIDPEWSPDGSLIAFASERSGSGDIYVQAASGRGSARPLVSTPAPEYGPEWEAGEPGVLFSAYDRESGWSIWRQPPGGEPTLLHRDPGGLSVLPTLSPDGRLLAYVARALNQPFSSVYLSRLADLEERWQVSEANGSAPRWSSTGDEIFYVEPRTNTLVVSAVETEPEVVIGRPKTLFSGADLPAALRGVDGRPLFDVTRDGQRVLVVLNVRQERVVATFVENWHLESAEDDRR